MIENRWRILHGIFWSFTAMLLTGCRNVPLLDPKGPIGEGNRFTILIAFVLMLIVIIPVFLMNYLFPKIYRKSNPNATYRPKWSESWKIESVVWTIPIVIIIVLSVVTWKKTLDLDPYKPIESTTPAVQIEAISMDWKWVFIYPDYDIAVINELVFPVNTPLQFRLTSDTVMASFFIPQLGSQIYTMGGMQTQLNLLASEPGVYAGQNQQFSGTGYANMHFDAVAVSKDEFNEWVERVKRSQDVLDMDRYKELQKPSLKMPIIYFSSVSPGLFDHIIHMTMSMDMDSDAMGRNTESQAVESRVWKGH